jgi:hypothetical protein
MINRLVRSGLYLLFGLLMVGCCEAQQPAMSGAESPRKFRRPFGVSQAT